MLTHQRYHHSPSKKNNKGQPADQEKPKQKVEQKQQQQQVKKVSEASSIHDYAFATRFTTEEIPKYKIPRTSMDSKIVYQIIHDEMNLDGNPTLNMATFLSTWMEKEAMDLVKDCIGKNIADANCYPQSTIEIQNRCVSMLADLYHATEAHHATGTSCVGSTEASMLGGLAMKKYWQQKQKEESSVVVGSGSGKPNLIMSTSVQVCWKKFCCYFDVEPRYIPLSHDRFVIDPQQVAKLVDENTIGVVALLGSTYTGHFEDVKELNRVLTQVNKEKGYDIGIHVDAASGGFIAPFLYPDLEWDFKLPLVRSINVSGHKYGLVYPGSGWIIWRDHKWLPEELIFDLHYLGGVEKTYTLNFSRSVYPVICQYYNFLRLGFEGYKRVIENCVENTDYLAKRILETGKFEILSSFPLSDKPGVPLISCRLKQSSDTSYTVYDLSSKLKEDGWIIPAYELAEGAEDITILRIVVKESFTKDLAEKLVDSLTKAMQSCEEKEKEIEEKIMKSLSIREEKKKIPSKQKTQEEDVISKSTKKEKKTQKKKAGHGVC